MSKHSHSPAKVLGASPAAEGAPRPGVTIIAIVWATVIGYLIAFFWTALPIVVPESNQPIRRIDVLLTLFVGDQTVSQWFEGVSTAGLLVRGQILAAAGVILLVAFAAGWLALRACGVDRQLTRLEVLTFSSGVGLNLVSLATLALGLTGVMNRGVFAALGLAIIGSALVIARRAQNPPAKPGAEPLLPPASSLQPPACSPSLQPPAYLLWAALPFVVVILLGAMMPPADFDGREYHLQAPKEFYELGRVQFLPHNIYANMPLGTEMLSLAGMIVCDDWWMGALAGKTLIALYAPLTALALLAAGRRLGLPTAGVIAALAYISIPWIALVSMQGLVEGAFAYYLLAALIAVMLWQASQAQQRERLLWLAGFLAGGAVSTKYPAVLYCVLPPAAAIGYSVLDPKRRREPLSRTTSWRPIVAFLLAVIVGCGLWLGKNAVETGNPVYPLLYNVFGGETRTEENDAQWTRVHDPPNSQLADLAQRTSAFVLTSPWLSPLVVPLAALALLGRRQRRLAWWLAAYVAFVFLSWWCFTHRIERFWVPLLSVVALLAGIGATWTAAPAWRHGVVPLVAFALLSNFVLITSGALGDNRYFADLNLLRNDPARIDPWHLYLNEHASDETGVLLVGDAEPFDLKVPALYNTVFDDNIFESIARGRTPDEVRKALADRNISHVYVKWSEVARYRSPGNYGFTRFIEPAVFDALVKAGVLAELPPIRDNPNVLYRVVPASPKRADNGNSR